MIDIKKGGGVVVKVCSLTGEAINPEGATGDMYRFPVPVSTTLQTASHTLTQAERGRLIPGSCTVYTP